jgi:acetolactate synthase I/II/III large subunit
MTGAEAVVRTLVRSGVDVCFANPGTTELHLMSALDRVEGMRTVLGLFEGVVSGAADGYARMADRPACTLLHLGPGFANAIANFHNARRACTPVVNLIGDHPDHHLPFDAPLTSDIESLARPVSGWLRRLVSPDTAADDTAAAVDAARTPPGRVATVVVPADVAWGETERIAVASGPEGRKLPSDEAIQRSAEALRDGPTLLLLGDRALREDGLRWAARIASASGCDLLAQTSNARVERGGDRTPIERVPYAVDLALQRLARYRRVVLAGAREPVAFFAYPGKPSRLLPDGCEVITLGAAGADLEGALELLAREIGAGQAESPVEPRERPAMPSGALDKDKLGSVLAHLIPENGIVVDESVTTGRAFFPATHAAPPHTWLQLTGGAIGAGLPMATGAALACPDRRVLALQSDGSGMYTLQALWSQAREGTNVTTIIFANRGYAILKGELMAARDLTPGPRAMEMVELNRPELDWVSLARGMGVPGERADSCEALVDAAGRAAAAGGPYLIEAIL